jgi:hypothetical protein
VRRVLKTAPKFVSGFLRAGSILCGRSNRRMAVSRG